MTSDGNANDLVLLPNDFKALLLPQPLIDFFDKFGIDYRAANSFSMSVLRSLYRSDYKAFYNVVYFLSLYGCNFHSVKNNSFFPSDVGDVENVFVFSGQSEACFSITDMNKYGVWDFCTNASSSKCMLMNGVVASRLKKISENSSIKLANHPLFFIKSKRLYGVDEQDEAQTDFSYEPLLDSAESSDVDAESAKEFNASVSGIEDTAQDATNDPLVTNETELSFSDEFFANHDESDSEDGENSLWFAPINSTNGVCSPRFWIRFVSSFFSMDKRAKEVYSNAGYKTFADLVDFRKEDIKRIVDGLNGCIEDPYLAGAYEDELVCFCKNRDSFLDDSEQSISLKEFLSPSELTLGYIQEHPNRFYYFNLDNSSFLFLPMETLCQKLSLVSDFMANYLGMFGITDLSFVGNKLLSHSINDYGLRAEEGYLFYFLRPINVVDSLLCSLMQCSPYDAFGIDHEVHSLWIPGFIRRFYLNMGKYGGDKYKRHLEILSLREMTDATLEMVGQKYGVTRERIRQIEAKTAKALSAPAEVLMDSLFQLQNFLPLSFARSIPGLYSQIQRKESKYYADNNLGIILRKSSKAIMSKMKAAISKSDSLQDCSRLDAFYRKNGFSLYGWLNKIAYHLKYNPYPEFMAQKISLKDVGKEYLFSKGLVGFNINKDKNEVMNFYRANAPYKKDVTYRAICNDVVRSGAILRGMSVYVSPEFITDEQKNTVRRILDETDFGHYGLTGLSLFERHKDELLSVGIDNGYFFYGIASAYNSEDYQFGGRSLRISRNGTGSLADMVEHYISAKGPIVKADDLLRDLHLKAPALQQITNLTKYDPSTLALKSWFKWTREQFEELEPFIDEKIQQQGFCHAYDIIGSQVYFDDSRNGFLKENRIGNSPSRLIYFLDTMAERYQITKYHFSHHCDCISAVDKSVETKSDMAMIKFKDRTFTKKESEAFFKKFHLAGNVNNSDFYLGWAYYVDKDTLILKQDLKIPDETIKEASNVLEECYGDEIFITSLMGLNRLRYNKFKEQFGGKPMELASVLSDSKCSNWCTPENDIFAASGFFRTILINKRIVGQDISYSNLIRLYVLRNHPGCFLSISDIQKELKEQELIDSHVTLQILNSIFSEWFCGPIVEVPHES